MMKFIDLGAQQKRIHDRLTAAISKALDHCQFIMGPEVRELEERLADFVSVKHAIGCASGTDALMLALMAQGVGPGDAVLTTPFTFMATAEVIALLGAVPVFVDIDPVTYNIDPGRLELACEALRTGDARKAPLPRLENAASQPATWRPKAVIAVDIFGIPADYDRIEAVCGRHGLFLIEDAAQSFGATYNGRRACSFGDVACTSFFPSKPLGGYGDGGMCFTRDDHLAEIMRSLRVHGQAGTAFYHVRLGMNGRLDTLQAAILLAKFEIFQEEIGLRQEVAARYGALLGATRNLRLPAVPGNVLSAWAQFTVAATDNGHRAGLQARLKAAGVPSAVYYPLPLHLQKALAHLGYRRGDFPVCEDCCDRVFSLPMHPYMTHPQQESVARALATP
jgi:dTDP-4-amino-4,6-dideoxygalactose transaminase